MAGASASNQGNDLLTASPGEAVRELSQAVSVTKGGTGHYTIQVFITYPDGIIEQLTFGLPDGTPNEEIAEQTRKGALGLLSI